MGSSRGCNPIEPSTAFELRCNHHDHLSDMTIDHKIIGMTLRVMMLAATLSPAAGIADNAHRTYKWVDDQGVTHYGDRVPPEFANEEQHIINPQGVETAHIDPPPSAEQLAAEERKRLDAEQQASRDKNLLSTYSAVSEIERLRDQRLALISDQIKVTTQFLDILDARLKKLTATSARFKPYSDDPKAPPMSDQIAEDLVHTGNDIRTQRDNLREKRTEEANMRQQFSADIARFKQLKGVN